MSKAKNIPATFIDLDEAMERVGNDEEFLDELLNDMLVLGDESVVQMNSALDNQNSKMLMEAAHAMKGAAANLALHKMAELAKEIEHTTDLSDNLITGQISELARQVELLRTFLK